MVQLKNQTPYELQLITGGSLSAHKTCCLEVIRRWLHAIKSYWWWTVIITSSRDEKLEIRDKSKLYMQDVEYIKIWYYKRWPKLL